jgi:beta-fructofuranosidase
VLKLPDKWVWDFWLAQDGPDYHIFYLQAPRELEQEKLRHWNASIGHAVSQDLFNWQVLPDALAPSSDGAWDDYLTWTGSIIKSEGIWYFFYTGGCRSEGGLVQRIGLATSQDLITWEKHPGNPLLVADPRWYETLDLALWHDQAWRDPWVFQHPNTGDWHAFITARLNHGAPDGRGCIAHARSDDLFNWDILSPVVAPNDFGHMEVPQLIEIGGLYYLLFSVTGDVFSGASSERSGRKPVTGTHYLVADDPLGPFRYTRDEFLVGDLTGSFYSGKIVQRPADGFVFLACRHFSKDGVYLGELSDPVPLTVGDSGELWLNW